MPPHDAQFDANTLCDRLTALEPLQFDAFLAEAGIPPESVPRFPVPPATRGRTVVALLEQQGPEQWGRAWAALERTASRGARTSGLGRTVFWGVNLLAVIACVVASLKILYAQTTLELTMTIGTGMVGTLLICIIGLGSALSKRPPSPLTRKHLYFSGVLVGLAVLLAAVVVWGPKHSSSKGGLSPLGSRALERREAS